MKLLYDTLVVLHLLGMAGLIGSMATELIARRFQVSQLALYSAGLQVLSGVALVGLASSGAVPVPVNNIKIVVKLSVALAILALAYLGQRNVSFGRTGPAALAALALGNVLVAVYW